MPVRNKETIERPVIAEWVSQQQWPVYVDGITYEVDAAHRAKNSFGALVLESSRCEILLVGDDFTVVNITN